LNAAPPPAPRRRPPFALNLRQEAEISLALELCGVAREAEFAPRLAAQKITAQFVTQLDTDARAARGRSEAAVRATNAKEGSTAEEGEARQTLLGSLRSVQSSARNEFMTTLPEKVGDYLVGEDIDRSRTALEAAAQTIVTHADADRPGSVDTDFLNRVRGEIDAYVGANSSQQSEIGEGKQQRAERDALVADIKARRKKIQYAADAAWPPGQPGSAKARKKFHLPATRPYSY
jgi:hypothetical protein